MMQDGFSIKEQHKGIHAVVDGDETVLVEMPWTIDVPAGYTYTLDPECMTKMFMSDVDYLLQIQSSYDCDFKQSYAADVSFTIDGFRFPTPIYDTDLRSYNAELAIKLAEQKLGEIKPGNVEKLIYTRDVAIFAKFLEPEEGRAGCAFHIYFAGVQRVYRGRMYVYDRPKAEGMEMITRWLKSIRLVTPQKMENQRWIALPPYQHIAFAEDRWAELDEGIRVPVPDGFTCLGEPFTSGDFKLMMIPEDYPPDGDVIKAPASLCIGPPSKLVEFDRDGLAIYFDAVRKAAPGVFEEYEPVYTAKCTDHMAIMYQLFSNEKMENNKAHGMILANGQLYMFYLFVHHGEPIGNDPDVQWECKRLIDSWLSRIELEEDDICDQTVEENLSDFDESPTAFTRAVPDESLYPHYASQLKHSSLDIPGTIVVNNAQGTEYAFLQFSKINQDEDLSEEMGTILRRIAAMDTAPYDLADKAREMQRLFHVVPSAFNPRRDRECELEERLMHRAYMMSGLRSFAWTLTDYCRNHGCQPEDVDDETVSAIVNYIAWRNWLNYDGNSYCRGLCSGSDLHVYFIPDCVNQRDREMLLPTEEDRDRVERIKEHFPAYREILPEVHSLEQLRADLGYIYPAVKLLWDSLARKRDDHEALVGDKADIVYAWCALALAAEEPFYSEDGPVNCFFTQIEAPEEKSAASPDQPTRDHVILYALVYAAYQLNGRRRPLWADFYRDYGRFFPTRSMEEVRSVWTADMYASDAEFSAKCFDQLDAYDTQEKFNWTTRVMYEMNGNPNREEAARFAVENTRVFFRDDELDAFYCMVDDLCRF